jgi:hypothetical protein
MLAIGLRDTSRFTSLAWRARVWYDDEAGGKLAYGPVAQLGARLHGMQKVRGSNPLRSTLLVLRGLAFHPMRAKGFFVYERLCAVFI